MVEDVLVARERIRVLRDAAAFEVDDLEARRGAEYAVAGRGRIGGKEIELSVAVGVFVDDERAYGVRICDARSAGGSARTSMPKLTGNSARTSSS
jgi:hypothetical protein